MHAIDSIMAIASRYDAIVFDQWGVLHNGTAPYPEAVATINALKDKPLAVLSNSGKLSAVNRERITNMGFPAGAFSVVMTSGEALSIDIRNRRLGEIRTLFPITGAQGDAQLWAKDLPVSFTSDLASAEAVLLMGLPDAQNHDTERAILDKARRLNLPLICSNPDRASPRADGKTVESPGALAHAYADAGGVVTFYGKPHKAIFDALFDALPTQMPERVLMVGDSPEHDIAGAHGAGWHSLFVSGGLHAGATHDLFANDALPNYTIPTLR